jgi:hypothetical protein
MGFSWRRTAPPDTQAESGRTTWPMPLTGESGTVLSIILGAADAVAAVTPEGTARLADGRTSYLLAVALTTGRAFEVTVTDTRKRADDD